MLQNVMSCLFFTGYFDNTNKKMCLHLVVLNHIQGRAAWRGSNQEVNND